jgi:hypothetical protein
MLPRAQPPLETDEETSRVQNISSVAPPPLPGAAAEITLDVPTYVPPESERQPLRTLGLVMVIGGIIALALVLILRPGSAPQAKQASLRPPPALPARPVVQTEDTASAKLEPTTTQAPRSKRAARRAEAARESAPAVSKEMSIRIRARVAPVRATPDADAKVLCSVKRGAVMHSSQQRPGSKGRWFAVHCDKYSPGWLHENFLTAVRP